MQLASRRPIWAVLALLLTSTFAQSQALADQPPSAAAKDKEAAAAPQWRAFWVDAFNAGIKTPEQVKRLVADLQSLHCNTVFVQVRKRGDAYFRKTIDPFTEDAAVPADFDPLAFLLQEAHKEGIQVHAWVNAMTLWRLTDVGPKSPAHLFNSHGPQKTGRANWLTCDDKGEVKFPVGYFLDAGHPDVSSHLANVVADLVRNYPVDGIHLDYIRYPEGEGGNERIGYGVGYNAVSVERFNRVHDRTGQPERTDPAWKAWRRQQITQLVRRLRVTLLETNPKVHFSAALIPWGDGPANEAAWQKTAPFNRVFQDWHAWRSEGLLDLTVPMNYDREAKAEQKAFFDHWIAFEKAYRHRSQLIVGLGAYLNSVADTEKQLRRALDASKDVRGAEGVCLYSYAAFRNAPFGGDRPTLDDLRQMLVSANNEDGRVPPFAQPAPHPAVPRLQKPTEGTLAGFATDAKGTPLDSQSVRVEPLAGGEALTLTLRTDGNGFYAAVFLKPGRYRVLLPGEDEAKAATVEVGEGKVTRLGNPPKASDR